MPDETLIADLIRAGLAPELVSRVAVLAVACAGAEGALARRKATEAARQARRRVTSGHVMSRDVTASSHVTSRESRDPLKETPHTPQETNPNTPRTSSLRSDAAAPPGGRGDGAARKGSRLPSDWSPSQALRGFAEGLGFIGGKLDEAVAEFRDYWAAVPGQRGLKLDWDATFRNRLRDSAGKLATRRGGPNGQPGRGSLVEAGRELQRRLAAEREARERDLRTGGGGGAGDPALRLLPDFGGQ